MLPSSSNSTSRPSSSSPFPSLAPTPSSISSAPSTSSFSSWSPSIELSDATWHGTRDRWPRILSPGLYERIAPLLEPDAGAGEPRWCGSFSELLLAVPGKEWDRLLRLHKRDVRHLEELLGEEGGGTWFFWVDQAEVEKTRERIERRMEECLALHFLFSRYCLFEFSRGTVQQGDTATVLKRLEGWGRDEMPSWEEREERWAEKQRGRETGSRLGEEREEEPSRGAKSPSLARSDFSEVDLDEPPAV